MVLDRRELCISYGSLCDFSLFQCGEQFKAEDIVVLNGTKEDVEKLKQRMEAKRAQAKKTKVRRFQAWYFTTYFTTLNCRICYSKHSKKHYICVQQLIFARYNVFVLLVLQRFAFAFICLNVIQILTTSYGSPLAHQWPVKFVCPVCICFCPVCVICLFRLCLCYPPYRNPRRAKLLRLWPEYLS